MLFGKDKLNTIEVINPKALIDSYISHDEIVSVNNVFREYNEIKEEIKNPETSMEYIISKQWKRILSVVKDILLTKIQVSEKLTEIDQCFYEIVLFLASKNQLLLKIKNSTILVIFEMIILT